MIKTFQKLATGFIILILIAAGCDSGGDKEEETPPTPPPDTSIIDSTFDTGAGPNGYVNDIEIDGSGNIIIGGNFTAIDNTVRYRIARLNQSGGLDSTFVPTNDCNQGITEVSIQNDGMIIIGGGFTNYDNLSNLDYIARLETDGDVDSAFIASLAELDAPGVNNWIHAVDIDNDGDILIGGYFNVPANRLARLNSTNGQEDSSFDSGSTVSMGVSVIYVQSDDQILVGGEFTGGIVRLDDDGSVEDTATFDPGTGVDDYVGAIAVDATGKIIIAGSFSEYNGTSVNNIVRLNSDGSIDATFNPGTGTDGSISGRIHCVALQEDGKILIGGIFSEYNGVDCNRIARLNSDGSLDTTFDIGTGANGAVYCIKIQENGRILIGGELTRFDGTDVNYITRLIP